MDAYLLEATGRQSRLTVAGRIHLIRRHDPHGAGVVGVETVRAPRRRYWARLSSAADYQEAVRANGESLAVRVSGYYAQERNLRWLLNATIVEVLGRADMRDGHRQVGAADQLTLFDV